MQFDKYNNNIPQNKIKKQLLFTYNQFKSKYYINSSKKMLNNSQKIKENKRKFKKSLQLTLFSSVSENFDSSKVENSSYCSSPQLNHIPFVKSLSMDYITDDSSSTNSISFDSKEKHIFESKYVLGKKIEEGTQGVVFKCYKKQTNQLMAVKIMRNCEQQTINIIQNQYNNLHTIQHQYIIQLKDLLIDYQLRTVYLVMQYCSFSNLRELMKKKGVLKENQIIIILKKILKGVQYLHRKGICHRDLKPQNILCSNDLNNIKIIDFEISRQKADGKEDLIMMTDTGTLNYRAPESFTGFYGKEIDIWAIGIIFFQLLTGKTPFSSQYKKNTIQNIKSGQLQLNNLQLSIQGQNFMRRLLSRDPTCRITADVAIKNQYLENLCEFTNKDDDSASQAQTLDEYPTQQLETF